MIKHKSLFLGYFLNVSAAILLGMSIVKRDMFGVVLYAVCSVALTAIHYFMACSMQEFFEAVVALASETNKLEETVREVKENDNKDIRRN